MNALYKLQRAFAADLWNAGLNQLDGVVLDGHLPARRLFQVYMNNFRISVDDALGEIYCVVQKLVGSQFFSFVTDRFLRSYPPRHGNLHQLGGELPAFLAAFKPASDLPYLADIARLDWAYHQVFHAEDAKAFNPRQLAGLSQSGMLQLHFDLASCGRLVRSPFPIFRIWRLNQEGYEGDQPIDLAAGGESVLVTRPGLEVELHLLDQADAGFLQSLITGCNLEEATEAALKDSIGFDLESTLSRYLLSGVLVPRDGVGTAPISGSTNHPGGEHQ